MNNKELVAQMRRGGWPQLSERKFYDLLDSLERSEAEKERLRAALHEIHMLAKSSPKFATGDGNMDQDMLYAIQQKAQAALADHPKGER